MKNRSINIHILHAIYCITVIAILGYALFGTDLVQCVEAHDRLGHRGQRYGNDIALSDAVFSESISGLIDAVQQCIICHVDAEVCDRRSIRLLGGDILQYIVKAVCDGLGHLGPNGCFGQQRYFGKCYLARIKLLSLQSF